MNYENPSTYRLWFLPISLLILCFSGCGRNASEAEQLAELRDGFTYTQYRRISEVGLSAALKVYRKGREWQGKEGEAVAEVSSDGTCASRVMLAYSALMAKKHTVALAETDIIINKDCTDFEKLAAASLRSVAFQRFGWPELAEKESGAIWEAVQAREELPSDALTPVDRLIVLHVALTYAAVHDQRWDQAQLHCDALGILLEQPWLSEFPRAGGAFQEGDFQEGLITLKQISRDPSAPESVKQTLSLWIAKIEARAGDIDSFAFMPRLVAVVVWDAVKEYGPEALGAAVRFAEENTWQPLEGVVHEGADSARGLANSWWSKAQGLVPDSVFLEEGE